MTINVLWMILAIAIGSGTVEGSASTADANRVLIPITHCYINGQWYNPCPEPTPPPPPPLDSPPGDLQQQQ